MVFFDAYVEILVLLSFLLQNQRNPGMDARIRSHCAWTRIDSDASLFVTADAKILEVLKSRSPHQKTPPLLPPGSRLTNSYT